MNSHYGTLANATTYFQGSLNSDPWDYASDTQRTKALITATRNIDNLNFASCKATQDQDLQFPRTANPDLVPPSIIYATYEEANVLLDGVDQELEYDNLSMTAQNIGGVKTQYQRDQNENHKICGISSIKAWRLLVPYLRDDNEINITQV